MFAFLTQSASAESKSEIVEWLGNGNDLVVTGSLTCNERVATDPFRSSKVNINTAGFSDLFKRIHNENLSDDFIIGHNYLWSISLDPEEMEPIFSALKAYLLNLYPDGKFEFYVSQVPVFYYSFWSYSKEFIKRSDTTKYTIEKIPVVVKDILFEEDTTDPGYGWWRLVLDIDLEEFYSFQDNLISTSAERFSSTKKLPFASVYLGKSFMPSIQKKHPKKDSSTGYP